MPHAVCLTEDLIRCMDDEAKGIKAPVLQKNRCRRDEQELVEETVMIISKYVSRCARIEVDTMLLVINE